MRPIALALGGILLVPAVVRGQDWRDNQGYFYADSGWAKGLPRGTSGPTLAFGGELFVYKGSAVEAELGEIFVWSLGGSYHFLYRRGAGRLDPFVVGGYSVICCGDVGLHKGFHVGGGTNYWFSRHFGVRFEVRDEAFPGGLGTRVNNILGLRIGVMRAPSSSPFSLKGAMTGLRSIPCFFSTGHLPRFSTPARSLCSGNM
jgi:hypothetical protein